MNCKQKLKEKIEKARKLVEDFKHYGIDAELNEETGEVTIPGSEWDKPEVKKLFEKD